MAQFAQPIKELKSLFLQTAKAVVVTQEKLEQQLVQTSNPSKVPQPSYSIPRTGLEFNFGLDLSAAGKVIIPFFKSDKGRLERHGHKLSFSVIAVPEPPPAPDSSSALPSDGIPIRVVQPHFLVTPREQDELCRQLAAAMTGGKWDFAFPEHGEKPDQTMVNKEAARVLQALTPDNPQRGMVVLKLDTAVPSYLIVRVTDKSKKDGLFVLTTEPEPVAMIYSFENDDVDNIRYAALHEMARTIRHWLAGTPPVLLAQPLSTQTPDGGSIAALGLVALDEFTRNLRDGYVASLRYLSEHNPPANSAKSLPSYYDVTDVAAKLSYSVYYDDEAKRLRFSFGTFKAPDGTETDDEISVIESRVSIRAYRSNDAPQIEINLEAPEFALTGEARQIVVDAISEKESAVNIARAFNEDDPDVYLQFLENEIYERGALVLLSYKGEVPKQKFLVVWPALYKGQPRDFVFICELKNGKVSEDSIEPVMHLEQDLDPEGFGIGVEITGTQYQPFHNVFHAIRMWSSRVEQEE